MEQSENRICQNCQTSFEIDAQDFDFYKKINVPPPTFCPECRFQRRIMFRNERTLYRNSCGLCEKQIITIFDPAGGKKVYCGKCWWSDGWDGRDYGLGYNPNINFFKQLRELVNKTPYQYLIVDYSTLVNSEYVNHAGSLKNCYLVFNADLCENTYYSSVVVKVNDSADCTMMNNTELAYGCIGGDGSQLYFSENCPKSVNVWYSKDCVGCTNCFGCVNLRNKSYHIFNKPVTKEEFEKNISEMRLDLHSTHVALKPKIYDFWNKFPRKYMYGRMNNNATGDYIYESKNALDCYQAVFVEDSRYCQFVTMPTTRDCYDFTEWGHGVERCIETITTGEGAYEVKYCSGVWSNTKNVEYSIYSPGCNNCFGCVNLIKKEYCILNKQYSKEEFFKLKEKIISDIKTRPYEDSKGRKFSYGEFLPYDLSPFDYNESFAQQYFPLTKEETINKGWRYHNIKKPDYTPTLTTDQIPDSINDVKDDFLKEIIPCVECEKPFRVVKGELELLRRFKIHVPRSCPDCRHMGRLKRMNKPKFNHRKCQCAGGKSDNDMYQNTMEHFHKGDHCPNKFETSYSPDRPEIVYCEKCYQSEVV